MAIADRDARRITRYHRMRKDPRNHASLAGNIAGLTPSTYKRLELLTHQVAYYANSVHKHLKAGNLPPVHRKGKEKGIAPSEHLDTLIRVISELQDLNEDILYNADLHHKPRT